MPTLRLLLAGLLAVSACADDSSSTDSHDSAGKADDLAPSTATAAGETVCDSATDVEVEPVAADLTADIDAYNDGCNPVGAWCDVETVSLFEIPLCTAHALTLEEAFDLVFDGVQTPFQISFDHGTVQDRAAALARTFGRSDSGQDLLDAIDTAAGSTELEGWLGEFPVPCHNCTDHELWQVLFYRDTGTIAVVTGGFGWDS